MKTSTTIKVLRQNFIKKHQIHPDYFYHSERQIYEEDAFSDREMFYPKEFQRKNHHQGIGKFVTVRRKEDGVKIGLAKRTPLRPERDDKLKVTPKSVTPTLRDRDDTRGIVIQNYNTIACQPSFVKTERLKRKVVSARESRRPLPKYSAYIMKPCSVAPAKMQPRPQSAFSRSKSTDLNKYMGFGLRKQQPVATEKKPQHYLMPWQTEYQQL